MMPGLARDLILSLFCGLPTWRGRLAVFASYSDESAAQEKGGIFIVGGYTGTVNTWLQFAQHWDIHVLAGPPKIPYLHMAEIRRKRWQKKYGLSKHGAEERVFRATHLIGEYRHKLFGIISIIKQEDLFDVAAWLRKRKISARVTLMGPDYLCFLAYSAHVLKFSSMFDDAERIDFFISRKNKVSDNIQNLYRTPIAKNLPPQMGRLLGEVLPLEMKDRNPLQAADCYCWHRRRHHEKGTVDNNFINLSKIKQDIQQWTREDLFALANRAQMFFGKPRSTTPKRNPSC